MRPSLASYSLGWSGHMSSPLIDRDRARQPEFFGSHLGSHSPIFDPTPPTSKSQKPRYFLDLRLVSPVGLEPTTYGLKGPGGMLTMLTERHSRADFNSEILLGFGEFALARRPYFSS